MKKSFLYLVSGLALALSASAFAHDGFEDETPTDVLTDPGAVEQVLRKDASFDENYLQEFVIGQRDQLVNEGIAFARNAFTDAAPKASNNLLWRVLSNLKASQVIYPKPGHDFGGCKENILAFVMFHGCVPEHNIYLCHRVLQSSVHAVGQTISHESAHTTGFFNECDATKIEVATMRLSGRGLAFRNGYMDRCGLQ